jgi:flagellar biosynthesis protein FlhB
MADAQDRNLPASARKIERARGDGQVARSRELSHLTALAAGGGTLVATAEPFGAAMRGVLAQGLRFDARHVMNPAVMGERLGELAVWAALIIAPMGLLMMLLGVAAALASGGWNFTLKPLMPNFSKFNPIAGAGRMVSMAQLGDMLKSCVLALAVGATGGLYLRRHWADFQELMSMAPAAAMAALLHLMVPGLAFMVLVIAIFAAFDVPLQKLLLGNRLKMSHEEVKQEYKEMEGNQQIKGRIKARMREIARRRMLAAVPTADLVVMNPTHYAVALRYDDASMGAPRVVAKGADLLALRIRDLAAEHKVPVLRMPPLARALYANVEVDQEIPAALFSAVAQVLAYVFQLRAAKTGAAPMPDAPVEPVVPPGFDPQEREAQ